jgi:hypothetical protein
LLNCWSSNNVIISKMHQLFVLFWCLFNHWTSWNLWSIGRTCEKLAKFFGHAHWKNRIWSLQSPLVSPWYFKSGVIVKRRRDSNCERRGEVRRNVGEFVVGVYASSQKILKSKFMTSFMSHVHQTRRRSSDRMKQSLSKLQNQEHADGRVSGISMWVLIRSFSHRATCDVTRGRDGDLWYDFSYTLSNPRGISKVIVEIRSVVSIGFSNSNESKFKKLNRDCQIAFWNIVDIEACCSRDSILSLDSVWWEYEWNSHTHLTSHKKSSFLVVYEIRYQCCRRHHTSHIRHQTSTINNDHTLPFSHNRHFVAEMSLNIHCCDLPSLNKTWNVLSEVVSLQSSES